jgi:hypothetical protein
LDWNGAGPYYWQHTTSFDKELLKIESAEPFFVIYGDFYAGWLGAC